MWMYGINTQRDDFVKIIREKLEFFCEVLRTECKCHILLTESRSACWTVRLVFGIKQSDGWTMSLTEFMCEPLIRLFRKPYSRDLV